MKLPSIKIQLIIFLGAFAVYLAAINNDALFLSSTIIAFISAIIVETAIIYIKEKKFVITDSSVISGLIIGYVLSTAQPLWIFMVASISAIISKYIICIDKKHLFNPAAFGIFSVIVLFDSATQWKGTDLWYILIPAGVYFISKIRKIEIVIGYIIASSILFGTQALIQRAPLLDALIYQNWFFIFIMLIEPKTTPVSRNGKLIFGAAVAALIFILDMNHVKFDAELCGLLTLNIFSPLLNKLP